MVDDPGRNKENSVDQLPSTPTSQPSTSTSQPSTSTSQTPLAPVNFEALNVRKRKQTDIAQYVPKKMTFDTQKNR